MPKRLEGVLMGKSVRLAMCVWSFCIINELGLRIYKQQISRFKFSVFTTRVTSRREQRRETEAVYRSDSTDHTG